MRASLLFCMLSLLPACQRAQHNRDDDPPHDPNFDAPRAITTSATGSPVVGNEPGYTSPNETAQLPHFSMRLGELKNCQVEPYLSPKPGQTVLGVEVVLEGKAQLEVPANPFYATLLGPSGEQFESTLAGCKPGLSATQLTQGKRAQGFVSFVVPERMREFRLVYSPAIIGINKEEARFQLPALPL